jgi:type I restriction enzyme, S subunit
MKNGWNKRRLGELCTLISGRHIEPKDYNSKSRGVGYLTGPADFGPLNPIISKWTEHPQAFAEKGDILITVKGAGVGKINFLDADNVAISRQLMAVRVTDADPRFIYAFLGWQFEYFQSLGSGATVPGISRDDVLSLQINHPPLPEQRRIVGILDEAFEGIATAKANAEKNHQNARKLFESHLQAVFSKRGERWYEIHLADVCQRLHQGLNTAGEKVKFYDSGYPIIQTRNIDNGIIELDNKIKFMCEEDWQRYKDKYRPEVGDVFFTNIGTIGKTAIVTVDHDYLIHWNIFKLRPRLEKITSEFLRYTLEQLTLSGYFEKLQKGGTVDFVTKKMISEAMICLPNTAEQKRLTAILDSLRNETQRLESIYQQKLAALDELKKSLLHQAFTGQL